MIVKDKIEKLAASHLAGTPLYVTNVNISAGNAIHISMDGDKGVKIDDCVALSRAIEKALHDAGEEDFSLDVSSHGATAPLTMPRQYHRHIGRELDVKHGQSRTAGKLVNVSDNGIDLEFSTREPKPLGRGKTDVTHHVTIPFSEIREARIKLKF